MLILILRLYIRRSIIMIPLSRRHRYYYYYTIVQTHWRLSTGLEMKGVEREWENESERKIGYDNRRDRVLCTTRKYAPPLNPHTVYCGGEHRYIIYTGCVSAIDVFESVFLEITFWNTTLNGYHYLIPIYIIYGVYVYLRVKSYYAIEYSQYKYLMM